MANEVKGGFFTSTSFSNLYRNIFFNSVSFEVNLNLPRGKTVNYFLHFFQVYMIFTAKVPQTKINIALYHARVVAAKTRSLYKKTGYTLGAHCISIYTYINHLPYPTPEQLFLENKPTKPTTCWSPFGFSPIIRKATN